MTELAAAGQHLGNLALKRPDSSGNAAGILARSRSHKREIAGDWMITGDLAESDDEGYLWFRGRKDDVITSSGYRIGPAEIEDAIVRHPKVALAAVIASPIPTAHGNHQGLRRSGVGLLADTGIGRRIRASVRDRLARHEYPREIEFVASLPMTATGKILRRELREREAAKRSKSP